MARAYQVRELRVNRSDLQNTWRCFKLLSSNVSKSSDVDWSQLTISRKRRAGNWTKWEEMVVVGSKRDAEHSERLTDISPNKYFRIGRRQCKSARVIHRSLTTSEVINALGIENGSSSQICRKKSIEI
jgi:hypothetical protein